ARNGRHHHLQGLDEDEDDGRGRPPLHELVLHELIVVEEAVEEKIDGRIRPHEPDTVPAYGHRGDGAQRPPGARGQSRSSPAPAPGDLTRGRRDRDRSGRTSRSAATNAAGRAAAPPSPSTRRTTPWARARRPTAPRAGHDRHGGTGPRGLDSGRAPRRDRAVP